MHRHTFSFAAFNAEDWTISYRCLYGIARSLSHSVRYTERDVEERAHIHCHILSITIVYKE